VRLGSVQTTARLSADPWVRGCAAAGLLLLAVASVVEVSWQPWLGWASVTGISLWDVLATRDTAHSRAPTEVWQTRPDE
jgi:hypothetical protein